MAPTQYDDTHATHVLKYRKTNPDPRKHNQTRHTEYSWHDPYSPSDEEIIRVINTDHVHIKFQDELRRGGLSIYEAYAWGSLLSGIHHLPDWPREYGAGTFYGRHDPQVWHAYLAEDSREEVRQRLASRRDQDRAYSVNLFRRLEQVLVRNGLVFLGMMGRSATWRPAEGVAVPERLRWEHGTCFVRDGWTWYMCGHVPGLDTRDPEKPPPETPILVEPEPEPSPTAMVEKLDRDILRIEAKMRRLKMELRIERGRELEAMLGSGSDSSDD